MRPDFFNVAVLACTDLVRLGTCVHELRHIEDVLGRVRTDDPDAPRTIDLDIVYYGDLVEDFDGWSLPDPEADTMAHVAVPIADVAPDVGSSEDGRDCV